MTETDLFIKNMVCPRCIKVVTGILESHHFQLKSIELGKAVIKGKPEANQLEELSDSLEKEGFSFVTLSPLLPLTLSCSRLTAAPWRPKGLSSI